MKYHGMARLDLLYVADAEVMNEKGDDERCRGCEQEESDNQGAAPGAGDERGASACCTQDAYYDCVNSKSQGKDECYGA